jgi:hypothetical protein
MMIRKPTIMPAIVGLLHDSPLMFIFGLVMLAAGLAMVLAHNVWSGASAVIVTLVGWASLIKGLLLLFLTPEAEANLVLRNLRYQDLFYVYAGSSLVIGLYLTYAGFKTARQP